MTRVVRVHLSDASAALLGAEARRRGMSIGRYLGQVIAAEARIVRARLAAERAGRVAEYRTADPPQIAPAVTLRSWRVDYAAVDAALERAGIQPDRGGR